MLRRRVAPRRLSAMKGLCLFGRRRRVARPRGDPALGVLKNRRAQQQSRGAAASLPAARCISIFRVLADPADVGLQRFAQPF
jgi:hypothetical protein